MSGRCKLLALMCVAVVLGATRAGAQGRRHFPPHLQPACSATAAQQGRTYAEVPGMHSLCACVHVCMGHQL
jgi:hypothetical protein